MAALSPSQTRFASVDALRGITVAAMLLVSFPGDHDHVYSWLRHSDWNGLTLADLVFPTFLFILGVSLALGPLRRVEAPGRASALWSILARAARIIGLGLALALLDQLYAGDPYLRVWGVLQRIGICYAAVGVLALYTSARARWVIAVCALGAYTALLWIGGIDPGSNLPARLDAALFGPLLLEFDPATGLGQDPEGLLSTLPAIVTTLIGFQIGDWLRQGRAGSIAAWGGALTALGMTWSLALPLNKALWTPPFAMATAGIGAVALAGVHYLVDRRGWPALGEALGRNAIIVYVGSEFLAAGLYAIGVWTPVYQIGFAWMAPSVGSEFPSLLFAIGYLAVWVAAVALMTRMGWRIRV